jgi:hypothetical protein
VGVSLSFALWPLYPVNNPLYTLYRRLFGPRLGGEEKDSVPSMIRMTVVSSDVLAITFLVFIKAIAKKYFNSSTVFYE